jgi:hypothetical protein
VGVSCVLQSSVGTTTAHLDAKINDKGTVLRVHMFHPKLWSTMKFVSRKHEIRFYPVLSGRPKEGVRKTGNTQQK